jgi:tetratricopeptide (TPR) repeat protein
VLTEQADQLHKLALAACQEGRLAEGIAYARQALAVDSGRARTHVLLGMALARSGALDEALASFDRAIAIAPDLADAHGNRADVLVDLGRRAEADASYDRALQLAPQSFANWCNRAALLSELGRAEEALACYDRALAIEPGHVDVLSARALVLNGLGRCEEAVETLDRALALSPDHLLANRTRGVALVKRERYGEALASFQRVLVQRPDDEDSLYNVAFTLVASERDGEALAIYDKILASNPRHIEALLGKGAALQNLARFAEAVAVYDAALAINPQRADAHYSAATALLSMGEFRRGLAEYEWRRVTGAGQPKVVQALREPIWLGDGPLKDKTLLIHAEQGMGDVIFAVRYVPRLAEQGARIVLQVQAALKPLLARCAGATIVVARGEPLPAFDCHCPVMSLPYALKAERATIPAEVPYIHAPPERVAHWRPRLPQMRGLRVGIVWCGNPAFKEDHRRSLKFDLIDPILTNPDICFVSLNPGIAERDLTRLAGRSNVVHVGSEFRDFADTAAVIAQLDLVITSDTSVAHLAGAMGRPVWIMLGFAPDWRFAHDREQSAWYPTARLFRQSAPGAWAGVVERVRLELNGANGAHPVPGCRAQNTTN